MMQPILNDQKITRKQFLAYTAVFLIGLMSFSPVIHVAKHFGLIDSENKYGYGSYGFSEY